MGRPKTQGLVCDKCGKDFSQEPTGTTSYKRHMARKNPCVKPEGAKYDRKRPELVGGVQRNDFDDVTMAHVVGPTAEGRKEPWVRDVLRQIFSLEENRCVIIPTKEHFPGTIFVKRRGKVESMDIERLCILTLLLLHERLWPFLEMSGWQKYKDFEEWVGAVAGVHLKDHNWKGTIEPASYYFGAVRAFWTSHLMNMPHRRHENWMFANATFKKDDTS